VLCQYLLCLVCRSKWLSVNIAQQCIVFRLRSATFHRLSAVHKDVYTPLSSSSSQDDLVDGDKPIKFSTSDANKHRAYDSFFQKSNAPWYQVHCITGSVTALLLYFCVFREENDADEELGKAIWDKIPQLQEQALVYKIRQGKEHGTDVSELVKELNELRKK